MQTDSPNRVILCSCSSAAPQDFIGLVRAGTEGSSRLAAPTVPALLTLTAEGVARVWVPVIMAPFPRTPNPPASPATPPRDPSGGEETAHFCVTLVVNPPAADGSLHQVIRHHQYIVTDDALSYLWLAGPSVQAEAAHNTVNPAGVVMHCVLVRMVFRPVVLKKAPHLLPGLRALEFCPRLGQHAQQITALLATDLSWTAGSVPKGGQCLAWSVESCLGISSGSCALSPCRTRVPGGQYPVASHHAHSCEGF